MATEPANTRFFVLALGLLVGFVIGFVMLLARLPVDSALADFGNADTPGQTQPAEGFEFYTVLPEQRAADPVYTATIAPEPVAIIPPATRVVPGSHLWSHDRLPKDGEHVQVCMSRGSVVVFAGSLIHRGGANTSEAKRLAITPQYCQPWLRQIENMVLAVPPNIAGDYSQRVQELLGYSVISPGFMGYVDGRNPRKLIG